MERTWPKKNRPIMEIDIPFFEHLLICMATQKFMDGELLPEEKKANQEVIDDAWSAGMMLLEEAKETVV